MPSEGTLASLEQLCTRFKGDHDGCLDSRFRLHVGRLARDVVVAGGTCRVEKVSGTPDVEIRTDHETWKDIFDGKLSGIEAFAERRLTVRGSIEKSLLFEPLFERPDAGGMRYSMERFETDKAEISALVAGDQHAPPLFLVHGLGANKSSWLPTVPALARRFRVIALDLPGFGGSSKPLGAYNASWFARHVFGLMDAMDYDSANVAGNSMGGRIAMEMAMLHPERVRALACLCPATAFSRRPALWFVRLLRPELAFVAGRLPRRQLRAGLTELFSDPRRVEDGWYDAAIDDFLSVWKSPRARVAFSAAARNIYLDEPEGERGFWSRLREMRTPALFVYGDRDHLITHHFAKKVRRHLPRATVTVWTDCGHAPQIEWPDKTSAALIRFFTRAGATRTIVLDEVREPAAAR